MVKTLIWLHHTIGLFRNSCSEYLSRELDDKPLQMMMWFDGILQGISADKVESFQPQKWCFVPMRKGDLIILVHWGGGDFTESSWWLQRFFIFTPTWWNDPIWQPYYSSGLFNHQLVFNDFLVIFVSGQLGKTPSQTGPRKQTKIPEFFGWRTWKLNFRDAMEFGRVFN